VSAGSPKPLSPLGLTATWFGAGLLPWMPGTWGSLAALPFAALLQWAGGAWALMLGTLLVVAGGTLAAELYARRSGIGDPSAVVIDEVAGQWATLVPLGLDPWSYLVGFLGFRLFDTVKPWPIRTCEKLPGGWGIMVDDLVAAGYAGLLGYALLTLVEFN
jgi:phosphatidylglycerophosphatase A